MMIIIKSFLHFYYLKTKLYVPVVTLSTRVYKKLSKFYSKEFERSVYWKEYKTKIGNKKYDNRI